MTTKKAPEVVEADEVEQARQLLAAAAAEDAQKREAEVARRRAQQRIHLADATALRDRITAAHGALKARLDKNPALLVERMELVGPRPLRPIENMITTLADAERTAKSVAASVNQLVAELAGSEVLDAARLAAVPARLKELSGQVQQGETVGPAWLRQGPEVVAALRPAADLLAAYIKWLTSTEGV
jgi:hypothetical protein